MATAGIKPRRRDSWLRGRAEACTLPDGETTTYKAVKCPDSGDPVLSSTLIPICTQALREGQLRTLVLSVYADKSHAEPIVQDIVIKPYARRCGLLRADA